VGKCCERVPQALVSSAEGSAGSKGGANWGYAIGCSFATRDGSSLRRGEMEEIVVFFFGSPKPVASWYFATRGSCARSTDFGEGLLVGSTRRSIQIIGALHLVMEEQE